MKTQNKTSSEVKSVTVFVVKIKNPKQLRNSIKTQSKVSADHFLFTALFEPEVQFTYKKEIHSSTNHVQLSLL